MGLVSRSLVGMALATGLTAATFTALSGCSLDWTLPQADGGANGDATLVPDGDEPDVPPDASDGGELDGDASDAAELPDVGAGDAVTPCIEQPTCADCVSCVIAELTSVGTASDCQAFGTCLVGCVAWAGPGLDCVTWCADRFPAGFNVRLALNGTCTAQCGAVPPCQ